MVRFRFAGLAALALATLAAPHGRPDEPAPPDRPATSGASPAPDRGSPAYVIYSLEELGADPDFGKWVAETIPEVIAPGTWKGQGVLRHYAPRNLLVVSHTPEVQAQVQAFLKNVKKSLHQAEERKRTAATAVRDQAVAPAEYRAPLLLRASDPATEQNLAYPVPAVARAPKHLFHFIIRYEGQGIIDDNVVKAIRTQYAADRKEKESKEPSVTSAAATASPPAAVGTTPPATPRPPADKGEKEDKKADKKEDKGS
jgi:hypothetical protein